MYDSWQQKTLRKTRTTTPKCLYVFVII